MCWRSGCELADNGVSHYSRSVDQLKKRDSAFAFSPLWETKGWNERILDLLRKIDGGVNVKYSVVKVYCLRGGCSYCK